ncbi:19631_t:CDS:2, partial [Racocetra fulgida]
NNVYYLDDTHINDQDGEPMQTDVNSSTISDKKVVTNDINCGPNYDQMEDYKGRPNVNDVIAYKEAKIIDFDPISHQVILKHQNLNRHRKEETSSDQANSSRNRFQIIDVDGEFAFEGHESIPEILNINWNDLCSVKKVVA